MSPFFVLPIIVYIIFMMIVGIAYLAHLIQTSEEYREKNRDTTIDFLLLLVIMSWPVVGLPAAFDANDDKYISGMEWFFIIFELAFWVPIIGFFINLWLF